jgi:hypothetical protein
MLKEILARVSNVFTGKLNKRIVELENRVAELEAANVARKAAYKERKFKQPKKNA